jgi:serine/threonine-protein kinase RsbW
MGTVTLRLSPQRAHVRIARLVAVAMARRSGVSEEVLDEIRLAVGEACGRAVQLHERYRPGEPVVLTMTDGSRFGIVVQDHAPAKPIGDDAPTGEDTGPPEIPAQRRPAQDWEEPLDAGLGLTLLNALVDDIQVESHLPGDGTTVRMSWPIDAAPPDDPDLIVMNTAV